MQMRPDIDWLYPEEVILFQECISHPKGESIGMQAISDAYGVTLPLRQADTIPSRGVRQN